MVMNVFVIVFMNSAVTFYLFMDSPKSPQFFYSVLHSYFPENSLHVLLDFAIIEAYLTIVSWTTIMVWALTSICCSSTINFWIKQLNLRRKKIHLSRNDSRIQELREIMNMWRYLQMLNTEYNSVCYRMTVGVKVAAFGSHLGTNYGSIRLFNSMKFQIWINCPLVSVCGLAVLLQLFKALSWVNVEALDCLAVLKQRLITVPKNGNFNIKYAERRLKSLRPLKVKGYDFYYFKRSTPVTFYTELTNYTITILLTF
ncbi:unnamed protein product [Orchesella dallaii]|uniref:Uncharacterized protein n=1 Tax=Orchesella dallaii TaxID=48710 RepID=A0ABP1QL32_9HEXA